MSTAKQRGKLKIESTHVYVAETVQVANSVDRTGLPFCLGGRHPGPIRRRRRRPRHRLQMLLSSSAWFCNR